MFVWEMNKLCKTSKRHFYVDSFTRLAAVKLCPLLNAFREQEQLFQKQYIEWQELGDLFCRAAATFCFKTSSKRFLQSQFFILKKIETQEILIWCFLILSYKIVFALYQDYSRLIAIVSVFQHVSTQGAAGNCSSQRKPKEEMMFHFLPCSSFGQGKIRKEKGTSTVLQRGNLVSFLVPVPLC